MYFLFAGFSKKTTNNSGADIVVRTPIVAYG